MDNWLSGLPNAEHKNRSLSGSWMLLDEQLQRRRLALSSPLTDGRGTGVLTAQHHPSARPDIPAPRSWQGTPKQPLATSARRRSGSRRWRPWCGTSGAAPGSTSASSPTPPGRSSTPPTWRRSGGSASPRPPWLRGPCCTSRCCPLFTGREPLFIYLSAEWPSNYINLSAEWPSNYINLLAEWPYNYINLLAEWPSNYINLLAEWP